MPLADTLLRLSEPPALFEPRWSDDILKEVTRTLIRRFQKSPEKAHRREAVMREFFPEALVEDYQALIGSMHNHPKDRHVLAVAAACRSDFLVTFNLKDFPSQHRTTSIVGPSTFLKQLWVLERDDLISRLRAQAADIRISPDALLDKLDQSIPGFVAVARLAIHR